MRASKPAPAITLNVRSLQMPLSIVRRCPDVRRATRSAGVDGRSKPVANRLAVPAGSTASAVSVSTSASEAARTVPSPPHAMTILAPSATALAAAWRGQLGLRDVGPRRLEAGHEQGVLEGSAVGRLELLLMGDDSDARHGGQQYPAVNDRKRVAQRLPWPSSTLIVVPVTASDAGDTRYSSVESSSAGSSSRFRGKCCGDVAHPAEHAVHHLGGEGAGGDAVDVDVEPRPLDGQHLGHAVDRHLGDRVQGGAVAAVVERAERGDVDDAPGLLGLDQPAGDLVGEQPRAADVGVEHGVGELERHLVGPLGVGDAGVVDRMSTRPSDSLAWATAWVIDAGVGDVERDRDALAAVGLDLLGQLLEPVDAAGGGGHLGPGGGEGQGEAAAETRSWRRSRGRRAR